MINESYIKDYIPAVSDDNIVQNILTRMQDFQIEHMAVIKEGKYIGLISEEQLLDYNLENTLASCLPELQYLYIFENQHILEATDLITSNNVSAVAIINEENEYKGLITKDSVYHYLTDNLMSNDRGSILVLSMPKRSYSLAEISRVVESENAKILGILVKDEFENLEVTLKVTTADLLPISSTLEKLGYIVMESFVEGRHTITSKDNYDYLMNYLNI